jgi:hypothetical protein
MEMWWDMKGEVSIMDSKMNIFLDLNSGLGNGEWLDKYFDNCKNGNGKTKKKLNG